MSRRSSGPRPKGGRTTRATATPCAGAVRRRTLGIDMKAEKKQSPAENRSRVSKPRTVRDKDARATKDKTAKAATAGSGARSDAEFHGSEQLKNNEPQATPSAEAT